MFNRGGQLDRVIVRIQINEQALKVLDRNIKSTRNIRNIGVLPVCLSTNIGPADLHRLTFSIDRIEWTPYFDPDCPRCPLVVILSIIGHHCRARAPTPFTLRSCRPPRLLLVDVDNLGSTDGSQL